MLNAYELLNLKNGQVVTDNESETVSRIITPTDDGVVVTYEIKDAIVEVDEIYKDSRNMKIRQFGNIGEGGYPALPIRTDEFILPHNCDSVSVELTSVLTKSFPFKIAPARPKIYDVEHDSLNVPVISKNIEIGAVPGLMCEPLERYRTHNKCYVTIMPVRYDVDRSYVEVAYTFSYKLTYYDCNGKKIDVSNYLIPEHGTKEFLDIDVEDDKTDNTESYLIITRPEYETAVNAFVEWKRQQGFDVIVSASTDWSTHSITDSISYYYEKCNLTYALLIGDHTKVPSNLIVSAQKAQTPIGVYSDHPYAMIVEPQSYNRYDDVYIGRIPARNVREVANVMEKITGYEKNPITEQSFYDNGVHVSYYQTTASSEVESYGFVRSSEVVREYMMNKGKKVRRVYTKSPKAHPKYWHLVHGIYKKEMPEELLSSCDWKGGVKDINDAINDGCFYVLYRDHGDWMNWKNPYYCYANMDALYNKDKLPIIFSDCCYTGCFVKKECLATEFLTRLHGGCVGMVAATHVIYADTDEYFVEGVFDSLWSDSCIDDVLYKGVYRPNQDHGCSDASTFGEVLHGGLRRVKALDRNIFGDSLSSSSGFNSLRMRYHLFGDPNMIVHTEVPRAYSDEEVSSYEMVLPPKPAGRNLVQTIINVSLKDEEAFVGVYNPETGVSKRYCGSELQIKLPPRSRALGSIGSTGAAEKYYVYVYGKNRIPQLLCCPQSSIEENPIITSEYKIKIIPNPVRTSATIEVSGITSEDKCSLKVCNWNSAFIKEFNLNEQGGTVDFDVSKLPDGRYVVNLIVNDERVAVEQMIVAK